MSKLLLAFAAFVSSNGSLSGIILSLKITLIYSAIRNELNSDRMKYINLAISVVLLSSRGNH